MIRPILTASALVCLSFACPSAAKASWLGWFGYDRPVIYRPITTAQTFYFQPSASDVAPARPAYSVRICRTHRSGRPHPSCR